MRGKVIRIHAGQSHGFIRDEDSREVFFHRSDTTFGTFNKLLVGDKVAFELIEDRVSGPRATAVRIPKNARRSTTPGCNTRGEVTPRRDVRRTRLGGSLRSRPRWPRRERR